MTTYFFPNCRLNVSDSGQTTAYFPTGHILERLPRPVEDRATARLLGYGSDTQRFRREHDVLLNTLAMLQGLGSSPLLHSLAHHYDGQSSSRSAYEEEDMQCARVHRWLNLDLWSEEIRPLCGSSLNRDELRDFLRAVLEGEITHIDVLPASLF